MAQLVELTRLRLPKLKAKCCRRASSREADNADKAGEDAAEACNDICKRKRVNQITAVYSAKCIVAAAIAAIAAAVYQASTANDGRMIALYFAVPCQAMAWHTQPLEPCK